MIVVNHTVPDEDFEAFKTVGTIDMHMIKRPAYLDWFERRSGTRLFLR